MTPSTGAPGTSTPRTFIPPVPNSAPRTSPATSDQFTYRSETATLSIAGQQSQVRYRRDDQTHEAILKPATGPVPQGFEYFDASASVSSAGGAGAEGPVKKWALARWAENGAQHSIWFEQDGRWHFAGWADREATPTAAFRGETANQADSQTQPSTKGAADQATSSQANVDQTTGDPAKPLTPEPVAPETTNSEKVARATAEQPVADRAAYIFQILETRFEVSPDAATAYYRADGIPQQATLAAAAGRAPNDFYYFAEAGGDSRVAGWAIARVAEVDNRHAVWYQVDGEWRFHGLASRRAAN